MDTCLFRVHLVSTFFTEFQAKNPKVSKRENEDEKNEDEKNENEKRVGVISSVRIRILNLFLF